MSAKRVTIKDIAQEASVSETTVSRYLNQKFEYMSVDTRHKIQKVIEELDYRPSNIARSLKSNKTQLLGAVIADIENPFSNLIIKGLIDKANELDYSLMVSISNNSVEKENEGINRFSDNKVDGLVVNTVMNNEESLKQISKNIPTVLIDRDVKNLNADVVTSNNYELGIQLMDHVLENAFKTVAYFTQDIENNSVRQLRCQSYSDSVKNNKSIQTKIYTIDRENSVDIYEKLDDFMSMPSPRVIVASNGLVQMSLLKHLKEKNYSLEKDFYFCGFDDWNWTTLLGKNGITAAAQDSYRLGTEAIEVLYRRMNNELSKDKGIHKSIEGKLHIRGSTLLK